MKIHQQYYSATKKKKRKSFKNRPQDGDIISMYIFYPVEIIFIPRPPKKSSNKNKNSINYFTTPIKLISLTISTHQKPHASDVE